MANDGLSMLLLAAPRMIVTTQAVYERFVTTVVELVLAYLIHSTLFIATAWILLILVRRIGQVDRGLSPTNEERLWKFVTVLAFVTVPVSQYAGWSWPLWQSSIQLQTIGQESTDDIVYSDVLQNHEAPNRRALETESEVDVQTIDSSLIQSGDSRPLAESTIRFSSEALNADPIEVVIGVGTPVNQTSQEVAGLLGTQVKSHSAPGIEQSGSEPEVSIQSADGINAALFSQRTVVVWMGSIITAWMLIGTIRLVIKAVTLRRFLLACYPASNTLRKSLPRIVQTTTLIRVLNSKSLAPQGKSADGRSLVEPFACGIWSWTVVVPESIEQQLSRDELRALLAHEVAHLIRRDPLWQWVSELLCACLPFQPLHFLVRRRWQQVAELMCDDWVVEQQISAVSLARCLAQIAELRLNRRPTIGLSAVDRSSNLTSRIEWLLRDRPAIVQNSWRGPRLITLVAFVGGLCVGLYGPRITLTSGALADEESSYLTQWLDLDNEVQLAFGELDRIDVQLSQDSNTQIRTAANRLRHRAAALKARWNESQ